MPTDQREPFNARERGLGCAQALTWSLVVLIPVYVLIAVLVLA